jgi:uncharacterized membrane protein YuzA (DUF378 family)
MSAPQEPVVLADTGGLLVTDDGRRVLVIDRRTSGLTTSAFVLGAITLVVGGFGVVAFIAGTPSRATGAIFLVVGLLFAVLTFLLVNRIRRRRNQPLNQCRPVAVIDRKLGLFSCRGGALVQLDQVRFARKFQIGSSSPKLVAETPGGTLVLKRGNPLDGGVGNVDEILTATAHNHAQRQPN